MDDVPDSLKPSIIYIVGNDGYYWQVVMLCPCNCKKVLHMNLMREHQPYWRVEISRKNMISLYPSIHRMVGCKSHFFVRKGKIVWAGQPALFPK